MTINNQFLIALIPARGGSKRIPGKNIYPFFGHPMLAYTIAAALRSGLFDRVIVTTDDPFIGKVAEWYGAEYLARPEELATDEASLVDVELHALKTVGSQGAKVDIICQLMPNCPLRRSDDIIEHYRLFEANRRLFQISVVPYRVVYPHWALTMDDEGKGNWLFGPTHNTLSQHLKKAYCPTGAIWWARASAFVSQRAFYGDPFHLAVMDANRGVDLDCMEDVEFADVLVRGLWQRDEKSPLEPVDSKPFIGGQLYDR